MQWEMPCVQGCMEGWSDLMTDSVYYRLIDFIMRILVSAILLLLLLVEGVQCVPFKRYRDYRQYMAEWLAMVPKEQVFDVSHMAMDGEQCYGAKCQFYYFESTNLQSKVEKESDKPQGISNITSNEETNAKNSTLRTVLLVSGMHGDEFIGPHTLLYAYKHLKADKIIYFPVANPSGFAQGKRETFPGNIDVNRDFPIDGNKQCYCTTATHILDMLFRKYRFDLTVALHNGGSGAEISYNWGTITHASNSHTDQYEIFSAIAAMLKREGGESKKLGLMAFKTGTMDEVVYPATGTFDDWAYAAGKFPSIITTCNRYHYAPYPNGMANGLVFLLELGPKNVQQLGGQAGIALSPLSNSRDNGFVARGVRMLNRLMKTLQPQLHFTHEGTLLGISVQGCMTAQVATLSVFKQKGKQWLQVLDLSNPIQLKGNVREKNAEEMVLNLAQQLKNGEMVKYEGSFSCDRAWQGKGTTSFALPRQFTVNLVQTARAPARHVQEEYQKEQLFVGEEYLFLIGITFVVLLGLSLAYCAWRRCCRARKVQKFDEVTVESEQSVQMQGGDLHTARGGIIDM